MSEKKPSPFTKYATMRAVALFLALWCTMILLSPLTRLRYLAYPIHFLFGNVGIYLFALLGYEIAIHLAFAKRIGRYRPHAIFGIIFTIVGAWALLSVALSQGAMDAGAFLQSLNDAYAGNGSALYFSPALTGGYFGAALFGAIEQGVGAYLNYLIAALALALGLFLLFLPLIKRLFRYSRAAAAVSKAKRSREKAEEAKYKDNDFVIETEPDEPKSDFEPLHPSPKLTFESKEEDAKDEPLPAFGTDYVFAPAGGSTLPSRKSLRRQRLGQARFEEEVSGDPNPSLPLTSPQEIANPPLSAYGHNPLRTSGLQEAVFDLDGDLAPSVSAPSPKPASLREPVLPFAEPAEGVVSPTPKEEPLPVKEEEEEELTPLMLAPNVPDVIAPEDEDIFVPPSNAPIVLAPSDDIIIASPAMEPVPEAIKAEQPAPTAPAPEPAPEKDDDLEGPLPPYVYPDSSLLDKGDASQDLAAAKAECDQKSAIIDRVFQEFGIGAHVVDTLIGPSFTRFSIQADPGVSVSVIGRAMPDLEVRLGGVSIRFVERVPGFAYSAMEIANKVRRIVPFKEVFEGLPPYKETADLHIPFGVDIAGVLQESDLSKFPHMLVGGTSGSGKSIFAHGILMSLVMRNRPENLKLVLIDPKRGVEMAPYKDLPHLLCPIVKEAVPARNCLKKLCKLMDDRYIAFEEQGVRDIKSYNADYALPNGKKRMPYIVVFVDEFADLVGECKDISEYVLRIAQKARACGIHLIVATQRPDVKVITGTIKSNLLCRVALTVASPTDSITIIGNGDAAELCGYGDMLIDCQELSKREFVRAQGCLGSSGEMKRVCDFIRKQLPPSYDPDFLNLEDDEESSGPEIRDGGYAPVAPAISNADLRKAGDEEKYQFIKLAIMAREYCSISMIQREFEVGFPRAGKIMARLQKEGIVASPGDTANNSKGCRVLIHEDPNGDTGGSPS